MAAPFISVSALASQLWGLQRGVATYLAFAPQNGLRHALKTIFTDPFSTVTYYWNWFDALMLLPYFTVMIVK